MSKSIGRQAAWLAVAVCRAGGAPAPENADPFPNGVTIGGDSFVRACVRF